MFAVSTFLAYQLPVSKNANHRNSEYLEPLVNVCKNVLKSSKTIEFFFVCLIIRVY